MESGGNGGEERGSGVINMRRHVSEDGGVDG